MSQELYELTWPGKREAVIEAGRPSDKTLRPCPELSRNFDATQNLYIEGDNLEALKILQKSYMKRVKMIYIDPPYNTGHDFIYRDDFSQSELESQESFNLFDESGARNFTLNNYRENSRANPRFHSDWLSMIYPRLKLARNLLSDDGVIFISIDDNEAANLRKICDEIFGESNFIAQIAWKARSGRQDSKFFAVIHEYILCYASNANSFIAGGQVKQDDSYPKYDNKAQRFYKTQLLRKWGTNSRREDRPNLFYAIKAPDGSDVYPMLSDTKEGCWRWSQDTMKQAIEDGRVEFQQQANGSWIAYEKIFAPLDGEERTKKYTTWIDDISNGTDTLKKLQIPFDYPKSHELITRLMKMSNVNDDSIILDFFAGSSTTAHAVMILNHEDGGSRKFIMIQIPELCSESSEAFKAGYKTICDIGRERILRAGENLSGDTGFRVLRVDSSNYRNVYFTPEDLTQEMLDDLIENIKPDRNGLDLLYGTIAGLGLSMSLKYSCERVNSFTVHYYGDNEIIACFDGNINSELVKYIADKKSSCILFRDSCFGDSNIMINFEQIIKHYAPDSEFIIL